MCHQVQLCTFLGENLSEDLGSNNSLNDQLLMPQSRSKDRERRICYQECICPFPDAEVISNKGKGLGVHNCLSDPLPIPQILMPPSRSLISRKDNRYAAGSSSVSSRMMEMLSNMGEDLGSNNCQGAPFPNPQIQNKDAERDIIGNGSAPSWMTSLIIWVRIWGFMVVGAPFPTSQTQKQEYGCWNTLLGRAQPLPL